MALCKLFEISDGHFFFNLETMKITESQWLNEQQKEICDFQSEADSERKDDENGCHGTPLLKTFPTKTGVWRDPYSSPTTPQKSLKVRC